MRSFAFWLLFLGALLAGYDGVREKRGRGERTTASETGGAEAQDDGTDIPPKP